MKYAVHLSTFTKEWSEDLIPLIGIAKEYGYEGVEIPLMNPYNINLSRLKEELDKQKMIPLCGTGLNPGADISSKDILIRNKGIDHLKKCIECCKAIGAKQLGGVLYSPWGLLKQRAKATKNFELMIDALKQVADYAKENDVVLCLEVLNRYESYVINTVKEGNELLKKINHDNVKLHFDTFHAHIEEKDIYDAIVTGDKNIHYVHFCDNTRGIPLSGQVDWVKVRKGLEKIKFDGWIGLENFVNADCEVGHDCMIWRQVEKDGFYAAKQGLLNMKKVMGE